MAVLEFASGALATLEATTAAWPGYDRRVAITGTQGTVVVEQSRVVRRDLRDAPRGRGRAGRGAQRIARPRRSWPTRARTGGCSRISSQAIETGRRPRVDGAEARRSVALIEAIYESSRRGQPVVIG